MRKVAMGMTQQKQRWFQAFRRISGSYRASNGRASFSSDRKRSRTNYSTLSSNIKIRSPTTNTTAPYIPNTDCILRYHSSTSAFRNPLHRNPSRISSSVGSIYKPPSYLLGTDNDPALLPENDHIVADCVRSCIKIDEEDYSDHPTGDWKDPHDNGRSTEMSLCFLGTGAGSPANIRSTSCTLLKLAGTNYLFDVGEGTQRQLQFARGKGSAVQKIEKIFVTHLHGDHIFGLPGLLLSLQTSCMQSEENARTERQGNGRRRRKTNAKPTGDDEYTVKIYGPPGLFNYIATSITLSCTRLHLLKVQVYELVGGRVRRVATPPSSAGRHLPPRSPREARFRDPFRDDYPEFRHNGGKIQRITVPCKNGVWEIQDKPPPLTKEEIINSVRRQSSGGGSILAKKQQDRIRIRAAEVDHMPGVATFGYVVEEDEPPRNLDVTKARALGVSHTDKKYELLKHGFAVQADDGSGRTVEPNEVLKAPTKKARKITVVGDNRGWTPQMAEIARDTDILVHEATLSEEDHKRGHSTAAKAGKNAESCRAKLLILNHLSPKMESDVASVVREAYEASNRKLSVLVSFDFLEVLVPWLGFGATAAPQSDGDKASIENNKE